MAKFFDKLDWVLNMILALLMAGMVVVIAAQVWFRFVVGDPLAWTEEAGRYMFVWISFLGAAAGVRYRVHLGIDLLEKLVPFNIYRFLVLLSNFMILLFLSVIIYQGFDIIKIIKFQTSASMTISMMWPYLAVPVGAIWMMINSIRVTVETFKTPYGILEEEAK